MLFRFSTWVILWVCCFGSGVSYAQGRPDISHLSYEAQSSIKIACAYAKTEGPASYARCISSQLTSIGLSPKY